MRSINLKVHFDSYVVSLEGLGGLVDNALACHLCDPGSNPDQSMWQGSGRPSTPDSLVFSTTFDHITPTSVPSRTRT